jgi:E3 ubiquitin-protein ligase HUWE1
MPPVDAVARLASRLYELPEPELAQELNSITEWTLPRSDLFHWVKVLDRFDKILQHLISIYINRNELQETNFTEADQRLIRGILWFSRLLVENCTNRNIYNSYEVSGHVHNADAYEGML